MAIDWSEMASSTAAGAGAGVTTGNPWVAAAGAVGGAVVNLFSQFFTNKANRDLQRESWDKMSISSRVKELEKNGLNKLYAAGSMPSYNLSTTMKAPEIDVGAALDAYASAKQIEQIDVNTQNAKIQHKILENQFTSSRAQAIMDLINQKVAENDYNIIAGRQGWNIRSNDNQNLQDIGFALKASGLAEKGDKNMLQRIIDNLTGYDAKDAKIKELSDELNALKGGYSSAAEYDDYLWDRPEYERASDGSEIYYDNLQRPYVIRKAGNRLYRDYNFR